MNYYNEIKNELINNEITKRVKDYSKNKSDLKTYYNVGKLLSKAGRHYGDGVIKKYSKKLVFEIDKKYDVTSLKRMRQFYRIIEKGATMSHQLSWSHYVELIPLKNITIINYYINIAETNYLSIRDLRYKIKNKEYERLSLETKEKLLTSASNDINDLIKDPIVVHNPNNIEIYKERALQELLLDNIVYFLEELGPGFAFIKNEYKIKIGNSYNYIDLLLYNIKFKCYVVIELKITELKKEHIGQILTYMNYIDKNIKTLEEDNTIGIILVKKNNKYILEYCSDKRILSREFELV